MINNYDPDKHFKFMCDKSNEIVNNAIKEVYSKAFNEYMKNEQNNTSQKPKE